MTADLAPRQARFLSIAEFAETFGIGKRTVSDLIDRGVVPVVSMGRRRLIPAVVVDRLEEEALAGFDPTATGRALREAS